MADTANATAPPPVQATPTPADATKVAAPPPAAAPAKTEPVVQPPVVAAPEKVTLLGDPAPKTTEAPKTEVKPPETKVDYSKLALPKDSMLDPKSLDSFKAQAEKLGLNADAAQEFINSQSGSVKAYHESLLTGHQTQVGDWRKTVEANPKLGGANLKATNEAVTQVLERFGPKGFIEELQAKGFNWHPGLVELLSNVHEATKTDSFVRAGTPSPDAPKGLEAMYNKQKK